MTLHRNVTSEELAEAAEAHGLTLEVAEPELDDDALIEEVSKAFLGDPAVMAWQASLRRGA